MTHPVRFTHRRNLVLLIALLLSLCTLRSASAQQSYVGRYGVYTGFSDLYTPGLNDIQQYGFHLQAGEDLRSWLGAGFDYSVQTGNTSLIASMASTAVLTGIEGLYVEGILPLTYVVDVPISATTQTFTMGPTFNYRHFSKVTLFIHPSLAAFRLSATAHPRTGTYDPIVVAALETGNYISPQGTISDWTGAYGLGGGAEFALTPHIGVRAQLDAVWNHPFNAILGSGGWSYRYSIGPAFHFGHNILRTGK
jgi:opacity protein-like surface antigen